MMNMGNFKDAIAFAWKKRWLIGVIAGVAYLLLYLFAIGDLAIMKYAATEVQVASNWPAKLLMPRAPFLFEPVILMQVHRLALFISPGNMVLGALLGTLVALNAALIAQGIAQPKTCGARSWAGVLGSVPSLFSGLACCAPALALALGTTLGGALIAVRGVLFPLGAVLLALSLWWSARKVRVPP